MARIHGRGGPAYEWLKASGIVKEGDYTRRVIIDIDCNSAVMVYIERFADSGHFEIPLHGLGDVPITYIPGQPAEASAMGDTAKTYVVTDDPEP